MHFISLPLKYNKAPPYMLRRLQQTRTINSINKDINNLPVLSLFSYFFQYSLESSSCWSLEVEAAEVEAAEVEAAEVPK